MGVKIVGPDRGSGAKLEGQGPGKPSVGNGSRSEDPGSGNSGRSGIEGIRIVGEGNTEKEKLSGLASVDGGGKIPAPAKVGRKSGGSRKSSTTTSKKKDADYTADMATQFLGASFNLLAMKAGPHWAINEHEARSLAEPIARIMDRYSLTEATGKYGDIIALAIAMIAIVAPKVMVSLSQRKPKLKGATPNVQRVQPPGQPGAGARAAAPVAQTTTDRQPVRSAATAASGTPVSNGVKEHLGEILSGAF